MLDWTETLKLHSAASIGSAGRARHAIVCATDADNHAVKVELQPDGVRSGWIPDPGLACAGLRIACPCEIGTQVLIVPVEGDAEHPVIVARVFDAATVPPTSPATGKPVQPGEFGVFLSGGAYLHMSAGASTIGGALHVAGAVTTTGDIVAGTISLQNHFHTGVAVGTGLSGAPEQ